MDIHSMNINRMPMSQDYRELPETDEDVERVLLKAQFDRSIRLMERAMDMWLLHEEYGERHCLLIPMYTDSDGRRIGAVKGEVTMSGVENMIEILEATLRQMRANQERMQAEQAEQMAELRASDDAEARKEDAELKRWLQEDAPYND